MVVADKLMVVAGPPDVLDEEEAFRRVGDPAMDKRLARQDAAMLGAEGALLWVVSKADGERRAELKLDSLPVFDGMAAAGGKLYLATTGGEVICFGDAAE